MKKARPPRIVVERNDQEFVVYEALPHQQKYHASQAPYLLGLGTRGTGKSLMLRWDAIIRCLMIPGFRALILRRTMPELRHSHLNDIEREMDILGGKFLWTTFEAKFDNGSSIVFGHCETEPDTLKYLSTQYGFVGFDELSTFTLKQFLEISGSARASVDAPYKAVVRATSNPLGPGAEWMKAWFVDKTTNLEEYPDYNPADFEYQFSSLADNPHLDRLEYEKRLRNLPEHVRRAWLHGEFVFEGSYFVDFRPTKDGEPWHVIDSLPAWKGKSILQHPWINVYRAVDWGYWPDPAVCLWFVVLPNRRAIAFMERKWHRTLAEDVAKEIKRLSDGLHVAQTFCDPTMYIKTGTTQYSIGEIFENNGVPLTEAANKRELYGYSIHSYLNTLVNAQEDPNRPEILTPQLQILRPVGGLGCPDLIRTIPIQRVDPADARKLADGEDHWVVSLAYFCMGSIPPSQDPAKPFIPRWMLPKPRARLLV